ncbi:site-specific DNA-methyltransferase [Clostridioides difficile]|uniref:DNA-methyltransferase n=1 Tax=Clostridioides difficile TaxID=1496 RepID=UPI002A52C4FF|nr:site-specific DNA-methyltransferase [Clostridioides difficile]MDY6690714.1 site-specific DNA-methyltransferase [Clostridioides difficile]HEK8846611.1 site-specific DNA-methyltransferase [Clostridioides difficile]
MLIDRGNYKLYKGDCLEVMDGLIKLGVKFDAIITDPPYGTTQNKWDSVIPLDKIWSRINKLIKSNGAIVLFGSEPFTSLLIRSNLKDFKYNWIWQKNKSTGFLNSKRQPLNDHEIISVFYKKQCVYNPQMTKAEKIYNRGYVVRNKDEGIQQSDNYGEQKPFMQVDTGLRYPKRIQYFNNNFTRQQLHPTQKPVPLLEYLIKTYTNEGDLVLDFTMGSGSTGVACLNTNRRFVGIELDEKYFNISSKRLSEIS